MNRLSTLSADPLPEPEGKPALGSESDVANRTGQDRADNSTEVDPTVSDRAQQSRRDLTSVASFRLVDATVSRQGSVDLPYEDQTEVFADGATKFLVSPFNQERQAVSVECGDPITPSLKGSGVRENHGPLLLAQGHCSQGHATQKEIEDAQERAHICDKFLRLMATNTYSSRTAAAACGKPASWFSGKDSMLARYQRGGVAALMKVRGSAGRPMGDLALWIAGLEWFIPAGKWFHKHTNRTADDGSVPEAVLHVISLPAVKYWSAAKRAQLLKYLQGACSTALTELPTCPKELREEILARAAAGMELVPATIAKQIRNTSMEVETFRRPRNTWLNRVQSPGSLHMKIDEETGAERYIQPGEYQTIDDATLNFVGCIPLEVPGNKCWEKFGCIIGRFQWLVPADHRTFCIPAWSYTARPKGSYRAEDLTATMHMSFAEHGVPQAMVLEHGVSASKLVHSVLNGLNVKIIHVASPHQKVIETIFNPLWTKLSHIPGSVGRFGGDEEETNKLVQSCRLGHTDPRKYFWDLGKILEAIRAAVADWNQHWVNSERYGRWQPGEWFKKDAPKILRPLDPKSAWLFSPHQTDALQVRGFEVKTTVPMMPGYSMKFVFGADWLGKYHGARVKLFFNPFANVTTATVVLANDFCGLHSGAVLGEAPMTDRHARFGLRALGYSDQPDIGLTAVRQHAQALRRSAVGMRHDGTLGEQAHEQRDGLGNVAKIERSSKLPTMTEQNQKAADDVEAARLLRQRSKVTAQAQIANRLREFEMK